MRSRALCILVGLGTALFFLPGCATTEGLGQLAGEVVGVAVGSGQVTIPEGPAPARPKSLTPQYEWQLGQKVASTILGTHSTLNNEGANQYLSQLGQALALFSTRPDQFQGYRFQILNSNEALAYTAPGGYLFFSSGLLRQAGSEAELAALVAQEIAHSQALHPLMGRPGERSNDTLQNRVMNLPFTSSMMARAAVGGQQILTAAGYPGIGTSAVRAKLGNSAYTRMRPGSGGGGGAVPPNAAQDARFQRFLSAIGG